ncbi:MAG TPA: hypothetical protein VFT26_09370, partial [Pyrinomonadaceae bacterium]|nr:hypothetical protein [Pyrinomonadaceae bacterium]
LRPEIFNRIDYIVPFIPLDRKTVEQIAERELKLVAQRDGLLRRGVTLRTSPQVLEILARRGYDAHYGARPLKRLIERELLLPLAVELNRRPKVAEGKRTTLLADVDVKAGHLAVEISGENKSGHDDLSLAARIDRLGDLRRRIVQLGRSSSVIELQNTIWRLSELERRIKKAARRAKLKAKTVQDRFAMMNPGESAVLALLPDYRKKMANLAELELKSANAEDEALLMFYGGEGRTVEQTQVVQEIETGLQKLLRQLLDLRYPQPNRVTMAIYSENRNALFELAQAYYNAGISAQMRMTLSYFTADPAAVKAAEEIRRPKLKGDEKDENVEPRIFKMFDRKAVREETNKPVEFLSRRPEICNGIVFSVDGKSAHAVWMGEYGLHTFVEGKASNQVFVHTSDVNAKEYCPPSFLDKRGSIQPANVGASRRTYNRAETYIEDHRLATRHDWRGNLPASLAVLMDQQVQHAAERLIEE